MNFKIVYNLGHCSIDWNEKGSFISLKKIGGGKLFFKKAYPPRKNGYKIKL